jgi:uncharacterized protein (DUF362 family)
MQTCGPIVYEASADKRAFSELVAALSLKPPVLIKPNWGTVECYTEADVLDWTLDAISGEKLVIESHGWARNQETLLHTDPGKLTKANLRKGEKWFLESTGIDKVLAKHDVEYLNLTEEVWAGRVADKELVRQTVEAKYAPVQFPELYEKVPSRVFDLRGGSLISLSKYKIVFYPLGISMAVKNLFGLVTGPSRGKFHGKDHAFLDQSITDINKIYRSLFELSGIIETIHSAGILDVEGAPTAVHPGCGAVFASRDTVSLDAFATMLAGRDPATVGHLTLAGRTFGEWAPETIAAAKTVGIKVVPE